MDVNWRKVFWPTNGEEARQRIADYLQNVGVAGLWEGGRTGRSQSGKTVLPKVSCVGRWESGRGKAGKVRLGRREGGRTVGGATTHR